MNDPIKPLQEDFEIWYKSKKESFLYINERSRVSPRWLSYQEGVKNYRDSIIKPINMYVSRLYPNPILIDISNNTIKLQQQSHAEIFLLNENNNLYNIDRPWIRQYYLSDKDPINNEECFLDTFRFYVPWIIDENVLVNIQQSKNSPFLIYEDTISFKSVAKSTLKIQPPFVHFQFKKYGSHMVENDFAKIPRLSPMYDMVFEADDIIINKVRNFYEQY